MIRKVSRIGDGVIRPLIRIALYGLGRTGSFKTWARLALTGVISVSDGAATKVISVALVLSRQWASDSWTKMYVTIRNEGSDDIRLAGLSIISRTTSPGRCAMPVLEQPPAAGTRLQRSRVLATSSEICGQQAHASPPTPRLS